MSYSADKNFELFKEQLETLEPGTRWDIKGPVIKSRECDIYRVNSPSSGLSLALKYYHSGPSKVAPQQQFSALDRCHPDMTDASQRLKVPKVFLVSPQHRLLVMEWINGTSLHHHLWNPGIKKQHLAAQLHQVGAWLRKYHDVSQPESSQTKISELLKPLNKNIGDTGDLPVSQVGFFPSAMAFLQCLEKSGTVLPAFDAVVHGDFTPANILLTGDRIYGLDIWGTVRRSIYHDVCRMIVYLTIAYPFYIVGNMYTKHVSMTSKLACFVDGYGRDRLNPQSATFKISLLGELLRRWRVISSRQSNLLTHVTNAYQLKRIEQQAKMLLRLI